MQWKRESNLSRILGAVSRRLLSLSAGGSSEPRMEALEPRLVLSGTPLPSIGDLESPTNTVIRFETTYGDVDIEMFDTAAPITVTNFLNYVTSGRLDSTFFHRSDTDFVLQGGGFSYTNAGGLAEVSSDAPIVRETTGRSNVARTIAMARSTINSATSQFFINYVDNVGLDPTGPGNGFAVFGRVIQGWNVIQAIQARPPQNLTTDPAFAGTLASNFGEVPVTESFSTTTGVREAALVTLINAEIVKPQGAFTFFEDRLVMPEGYRSDTASELIELTNPNSQTMTYQVIARYETGVRENVIASGTIAANSSLEIALSRAGDAALNLVRSGTPYSLTIETAVSTDAEEFLPAGASLNRTDFNGTTSEAFFNPGLWSNSDLLTWDLPRIERNSLSREFIVWQNLTDQQLVVQTQFITATGTVDVFRVLPAYRRGGLEVHSLSLPEGTLAARVIAAQPIAVALSDFDLPSAGVAANAAYTPAFGVVGMPGGGTISGALAGVEVNTGFANLLSISNAGNTAAVVTIRLWSDTRLPTEDPITRSQIVLAGQRADFVIDPILLGITPGSRMSVTYTSGSAPVAVQYTNFAEAGRNAAAGAAKQDGYATMFATRLAERSIFSDVFLDPTRAGSANQQNVLAIFNPYATTAAVLTYNVQFLFSDGTVIDGATGTLDGNERTSIAIGSITDVVNKVNTGEQFRRFSIVVSGTVEDLSPPPGDGPEGGSFYSQTTSGLVSLMRLDTVLGRGIATGPNVTSFVLSLTDPVLTPGGTTPSPV